MQVWSSQAGQYPHNESLDTPHAYGVLKNMVYTVLYTVRKKALILTFLQPWWCGGGDDGGVCDGGSRDGGGGGGGDGGGVVVVTDFVRMAGIIVVGALQ